MRDIDLMKLDDGQEEAIWEYDHHKPASWTSFLFSVLAVIGIVAAWTAENPEKNREAPDDRCA